MRCTALIAALVATVLVSCGDRSARPEDFGTRVVKLPNGREIRCEVMTQQKDMARGMMFRDSLAPDRGMLFVHGQPGNYPYWMFQVKIPLDIIWIDSGRRIVEMSLNTPPCEKGPASACPNYGGNQRAQFVLELAAGVAEKNGLKVGDLLEF